MSFELRHAITHLFAFLFWVLLLMLFWVPFSIDVEAAEETSPVVNVSLNTAPLSESLLTLAAEFNVLIMAPADVVQGFAVQKLAGPYSIEEALSSLLNGLPLDYEQNQDGVFFIYAVNTEKQLEEVVVFGEGNRSSLGTYPFRRSHLGIVDGLDSIANASLPTGTLADRLARLPGISVTREADEGQFIAVRGLGPSYQQVTFAGSPLATNENLRTSDMSGSMFRFRSFAGELFEHAYVYKTSDPTRPSATGAHIDLFLPDPLWQTADSELRHWQHYDENTQDFSPGWLLKHNGQNKDETFAWSLGITNNIKSTRFDRLQTFGFTQTTLDNVTYKAPGSIILTSEYEQRERTALSSSLAYLVSPSWQINADIISIRFNNKINEQRLSFPFASNIENADPNSIQTSGNLLQGAKFTGGTLSHDSEYSQQQHKNDFIRIASEIDHNQWTIQKSVSYGKASSDLTLPLQRIRTDRILGNDEYYEVDLGSDPVGKTEIHSITTSIDLTDPSNITFGKYQIRPVYAEDIKSQFRINGHRPVFSQSLWADHQLDVGFSWQNQDHNYLRRDRNMELNPDSMIREDFYKIQTDDNVFHDLIGTAPGHWTNPSLSSFSQTFHISGSDLSGPKGYKTSARDLTANPDDAQRSYQVKQQKLAQWFKLQSDLADGASGIPLSGFMGLRTEWYQRTVKGAETSLNQNGEKIATPIQYQSSQLLFMPSAQIKYKLTQSTYTRFSISRGYDMPSLSDITPAVIPSSSLTNHLFNNGKSAIESGGAYDTVESRIGISGTPNLKPVKSTNIDLSLDSQLSDYVDLRLAVFHKRLDNVILYKDVESLQRFTVNDDEDLEIPILISQPQNSGQEQLWGFEGTLDCHFTSGWGLRSHYSRIRTTQVYEKAPLIGVPKISYGLVPYFRNQQLEMTLSANYRSRYATNPNTTLGTSTTGRDSQVFMDEAWRFDASLNWHLTDLLDLRATAKNLNAQRQSAYVESQSQFLQLQSPGRSFELGIKASF